MSKCINFVNSYNKEYLTKEEFYCNVSKNSRRLAIRIKNPLKKFKVTLSWPWRCHLM